MYLPGVSQADRATRTERCSGQVVIDSVEALDALLDRHPYLRDHPRFSQRYRDALLYLELMKMQKGAQIGVSIDELIERYGGSRENVRVWLLGERRPILVKMLITHELSRRKYEVSLSPEVHLHRVDPSRVYEAFKVVKTGDFVEIASAIERLHLSALDKSVLMVELRPYNYRGPHWFYRIAGIIRGNRREIEAILNQRLARRFGKDQVHKWYRIGVVTNRLYFWCQDTRTDYSNGSKSWLNLYKYEHFHFQPLSMKRLFVEEACRHLRLRRGELSKLVGQITDYPHKIPKDNSIMDFLFYRSIMHGGVLHFLLDIIGKPLKAIESHIASIGAGACGGGRILHPKFPSLEPFRTKVMGAMLSDGHLPPSRHPTYNERDSERRKQVMETFSKLGEIQIRIIKRGNDNTIFSFPVVVGRLLEKWGMPVGDKTILNPELPSYILQGSREVQCAYLAQLIPEEGCVTVIPEKNRIQLSWGRSLALDAGVKAKSYKFKPLISAVEKKFLHHFGTTTIEHYGDPDKQVQTRKLSWAELKRLTHSKDPEVVATAKRLKQCVHDYPCHLVEGEVSVCRGLGIKIAKRPTIINLYEKSGRVTVQWLAITRRTEDAIRWALLAPPDDQRKRGQLVEGLKRLSSLVEKVAARLREEGKECSWYLGTSFLA